MIGAAIEFRTLGGYREYKEYLPTFAYLGIPGLGTVETRHIAHRSKQGWHSSTANVTGQRQARCHDFPDAIQADDSPPVLDDVETPGQHTEPVATVDHTGRPVTRQSDRPFLIWWLMMQQPAKDMIDELQPHDRDDIKQDLAIKYWRQSVKQEANGKRITNPAQHIAKAVSAWIGKNTATAQSGPLTQQQREDAVDALDAQRKASEESRLAKLEAELKIEQGRFAAALAAKQDAKQPKSLFCFKW